MALTADEKQMIGALFDRVQAQSNIQRDADAEQFINERMRANPAAAYVMTQTILMQEQAMQMGQQRVRELEAELERARAGAMAPQPQAGGFLGGAPSGPWGSPRGGSVPPVPPMPPQGGPWGQSPMPGGPMAGGPMGAGPMGGMMPQAGGGGFLRSALATAAGVAGGAMLFNGISNMFGGGPHGGQQSAMSQPNPSASNASDSNPGNLTSSFDQQQHAAYDPAAEEDDGGYDDGGDGGGDWA